LLQSSHSLITAWDNKTLSFPYDQSCNIQHERSTSRGADPMAASVYEMGDAELPRPVTRQTRSGVHHAKGRSWGARGRRYRQLSRALWVMKLANRGRCLRVDPVMLSKIEG
jgi:hypothetical protein